MPVTTKPIDPVSFESCIAFTQFKCKYSKQSGERKNGGIHLISVTPSVHVSRNVSTS